MTQPDFREVARDKPPPYKVKSICCLMLAEIGDILVTTPTMESLRQLYPDAHLAVILRRPIARLLEGNPHIDEVILYDNSSALTIIRLLLRLLTRSVDLWVDLHTPTFNTVCSNEHVFRRNHFIRRFAQPRYSIGFYPPEGPETHSHGLPFPDERAMATENIVDTTLRLTRQWICPENTPYKKYFHLHQRDKVWADEQLTGYKDSLIVGLFFGSKQPVDRWTYEHTVRFMELLFHRYPEATIVILGGQQERLTADSLHRDFSFDRKIVNFCGQADLGQTGALMTQCRVLVSTDSGPMHIADALSVPMVALFSSKNHLPIWLPVQSPAEIINMPVNCGPCFQNRCDKPETCMEMIHPQLVMQALERLLASATTVTKDCDGINNFSGKI